MMFSKSLLPLFASLALCSSAFARDEPTLEQRLDKLAETLEAARLKAHIPGMSIAIVKDDEVIWARGFGMADVAEERPADENTVYAIGSTTKAFTATLVGMLVDDGKVSWDDPVTKYLPYFDLAVRSDDKSAECTLRDLLSHRHGFARMGLLWFGGRTTRDEVLRVAAGAEPWDDFRTGFHYNNVTYLAAGQAAGIADGTSWDELMVSRIFEPLGMTSSTLSISDAVNDERLARGYRWNPTEKRFDEERLVPLDNIGPAGSVNSNVVDVAQWIRMLLARGEHDGNRLISNKSVRETWTPQIGIADGVSYGLGWMLREHDGRRVVEHGGNINGFTAEIGLMPEEKLGYVLFMNLSVSPLRLPSLKLVFDGLLGEWSESEAVEPAAPDEPIEIAVGDLEDYVGVYVANFAKFRDTEFEVRVNDGVLAIDIPGQLSSDLNAPNSDGRWVSALTDRVSISFARNESGSVQSLTMHSNGFNFEVPRKGVVIAPEVPAKVLEKYVGTYVREQGGKRVKLSVLHGMLTMEDRGNRLAFQTPDEEGNAWLRAREDHGATFKTDAEGNAESFIYHGSSGDKLFTRLPDLEMSGLPTNSALLELRNTAERSAAWSAAGGSKVTGKVWVPQSAIHGTVALYSDGRDRSARHLDFGVYGRVSTVIRDGSAWLHDPMRGISPLQGDDLASAILDHPESVEGDWRNYFDSFEVIGNEELNGRRVHIVRLTKGRLPSRTYRVDAETGDVLRMNHISINGSVRVPVTTNFSEFEVYGGVRRAMRIEIENPTSGRIVLNFAKVETGLQFDEATFAPEPRED